MKWRSTEIIQDILISGVPERSIKKLAAKFKVSERTLYNDIAEINDILSNLNLPIIITDGNGNMLVNPNTNIQTIRNYLDSIGPYAYRQSAIERQCVMVLKLLSNPEPITISKLSDLLYVARTTINSDIEAVKVSLKKWNVTIGTKKPHGGLTIQCDTKQARDILVDTLLQHIDTLKKITPFQRMALAEVQQSVTLEQVIKAVSETENQSKEALTERDYSQIVVIVFVCVNLYHKNKGRTEDNEYSALVNENSCEMRFSRTVLHDFGITNNSKIAEVADLLYQYKLLRYTASEDETDMYTMVADFLLRVSNTLRTNLFTDSKAFAYLVRHFTEIIKRSNSGRSVKSIYIEDLLVKYADVFHAVQKNISNIESYFRIKLSRDELTYVVMHICAALERKNAKASKLSIMVVSPDSMAAGQMLSSQLENQFNLNICGVFDRSNLANDLISEVDLVISTENLDFAEVPVAVVNPILRMDDFDQILTTITLIRHRATDQKVYVQSSRLIELMEPGLILANANAGSWSDAIIMCGQLLIDNGFVAPSYIKAIIRTVEKNGPYFVIAPHIALAHARPEAGVIHPSVSLAVFPQGVSFGLSEHDPVQFLFCVSEQEPEHYLDIFNCLVHISSNRIFANKLLECKTPAEVYQLFTQSEIDSPNIQL